MKYIYALIGVILLSMLSPFEAQASAIGKFTHVEGRVDITRPDQAARPAHIGDEVFERDIIRAKSRSKAEIVFMDGNLLRLAQNTRVEISEFITTEERKSTVLRLFRGKIQNKVKKFMGRIFGKNKDRFEVHTPTSVCGVRGTNFFTFYQKGLSGAIFKEGSGYGYSLNRPEEVREIPTGQAMLVTSSDRPPVVRPATEAELLQHEGDTTPSEEAGEEKDDDGAEQGSDSDDGDESKETDNGDNEGEESEENNGEEDGGMGEDAQATDGDPEDDGGVEEVEEEGAEDTGNPEAGPDEAEDMDREPQDHATGETGPDDPGDSPETGDPDGNDPSVFGSGESKPEGEGPGDRVSADSGPGEYLPGDEGPGDYGPGETGANEHEVGDPPMEGDPLPVKTAMLENTVSDIPMIRDKPIKLDPVLVDDPVFHDPMIVPDNSYGDPIYDNPVVAEDPFYSDTFMEDPYFYDPSSDPVYIPPDITLEEPFTIETIKIHGDVNPGPLTIYDGNWVDTYYDYYLMDLAGTFSWEPPFIHMSPGVQGRVMPGSGPLSEAFYRGFAGASWDLGPWEEPEKRVRGVAHFFYAASDGSGGFLDGDIYGNYTDSGTWQATGYIMPIEMTPGGLPFDFPEIVPRELVLETAVGFFEGSDGGTISVDWGHGFMASIPGQDWGMWRSEFGGTYTDLPGDNWVMIVKDFSVFPEDTIYRYYQAKGYKGAYGEMEADVAGGWVDIANVVTGVFEGGLHGGYDPMDPAKNFFALSGGVWIETNRFLDMTSTIEGREKLHRLYIPCIEVGRANLMGSSGVMSVHMNDVTFFANSASAPPRIWATNGVSGSTYAAPAIDHTVNLTGNGLQVDFRVKKWDSGVWRADINGMGHYSGTGNMNDKDIDMNGGAAGTYSGSAFSGTAAGAARVMPPP